MFLCVPVVRGCVVATVVTGGGVSPLYVADNALNGIPTCASPVLRKLLRDQWGFTGYMTSDSGAISDIYLEHKYAGVCRTSMLCCVDLPAVCSCPADTSQQLRRRCAPHSLVASVI